MTKPFETVQAAFRLHDEGHNISQISEELGVSRMAVRSWFVQPLDAFVKRVASGTHEGRECPLIQQLPRPEYAYLLAQYLGDGSISKVRNVFRLRIATCNDYPEIRQRCADAMKAVMPDNIVGFAQSVGCGEVSAYSTHWPCLFPQHGPGKKHERSIVLDTWQQDVVRAFPQEFVTGLIHSDGWRGTNNVTVRGNAYSYPRYMFKNESTDILELAAGGSTSSVSSGGTTTGTRSRSPSGIQSPFSTRSSDRSHRPGAAA